MEQQSFETPILSQNWKPLNHPIVTLETPFRDSRGEILPLVDEDMKSAVLITSLKGTVRANHYHKTDWHYCYVLEGSLDYYYREVGSKAPPQHVRIEKGQMFFTPPLLEHAFHFLADTTFLCLGKNSREQSSYEADVVRVEVFQPK